MTTTTSSPRSPCRAAVRAGRVGRDAHGAAAAGRVEDVPRPVAVAEGGPLAARLTVSLAGVTCKHRFCWACLAPYTVMGTVEERWNKHLGAWGTRGP